MVRGDWEKQNLHKNKFISESDIIEGKNVKYYDVKVGTPSLRNIVWNFFLKSHHSLFGKWDLALI